MDMERKILIVEDEDVIARVLRIRLEALGYIVAVAGDGEEGLELVKKEKPDLAIIDIGLPRIDGNTLCELIRAEAATKGTKIIILTGKRLVGDMETAFQSGADIYMSKPYEWQRLLDHIKKLLGETD
ncbi:MAG TPA: two-component system response regulator [Elusimicrobia bacterium]|nr:two-component system response regulator [Elusimicrobiota bacterium]HBW22000.1 two-component system response regulator [Elusimicrobiota bacterium]